MSSKRILLIEDNKEDASFAKRTLEEKGYEVFEAFTGKDGIDMALSKNPDLILLDLILPDMTGEEVCRQLKEDKRTRKIIIIILSVKDEIEDIQELFRRGANDYIIKPPVPEYLVNKVSLYIGC